MIDIEEELSHYKKPKDWMGNNVQRRHLLQQYFIEVLDLICINPDEPCARCGECCMLYAASMYAVHKDRPCKPEFNNPCSMLVLEPDGKYSCKLYGKENYPKKCSGFPDGAEIALFNQFLNGDPLDRFIIMPSCVYRFRRRREVE